MSKSVFCFVILHYLDLKMTEECINSIIDIIDYDQYYIVIVDNASPNGSGEKLKEQYKRNNRIVVLESENNVGFANGNNLGYAYAQKKLKSDFIICINNDVLMKQRDFLQRIITIEEKEKCAILGPDIISKSSEHQSPRRIRRLSLSEVKKNIFRKRIMLLYFYWKKHLFRLKFVDKLYAKSNQRYKRNICSNNRAEDVVLLGACIIYCPQFVKNERYAFSPKTFMYGEEDLLAWYCHIKKYKTIFNPEIRIIHLGEIATQKSRTDEVDKMIFLYKNTIKGLEILKKEMNKG